MVQHVLLLLLTLFALLTSRSSAARQFKLKVNMIQCFDLVDMDANGEDNGVGDDTEATILIPQNGERAKWPYYYPNSNSPRFSWATNGLDAGLGNTVRFILEDYDRYIGNRRQKIGEFSVNLPSSPYQWTVSEFGSYSEFGDIQTVQVNTGGSCTFRLKFFAEKCNVGEYRIVEGFCKRCDKGFYCNNGFSQEQCDAGTYSSTPGNADPKCTQCEKGKFQPGRGQESCMACPDGEYTDKMGQTKCSSCPAGRYGKGDILRTDSSCTGPCAKGYFCPLGSTSKHANLCGGFDDASKFCPEGSGSPRPVTDGYYSIMIADVPGASYAQEPCPKGHYCQSGIKRACEANYFATLSQQTQCTSCLAYAQENNCAVDEYRKGCGGVQAGTCTTCQITSSNNGICTEGYDTCNGATTVDTSGCRECDCPRDAYYWKKLTDGGGCAECKFCTYNATNCNDPDRSSASNDPSNNRYLVDACRLDSNTHVDSKCKKCDEFCLPGEKFNKDCSGETGPVCSTCRMSCGGCDDKKDKGSCASNFCFWEVESGRCIPHPLTGQYINPETKCSGKTFDDTTECLECSTVNVPAGKFMVNCQSEEESARFKTLTECVDGFTYESKAPTRITDRECKQCNVCPKFTFEAEPCTKDQKAKCVPVSYPSPGQYVRRIATASTDALILDLSNCEDFGKWEDLTQPPIRGAPYEPGSDRTCNDYNPCDLKTEYIVTRANATQDWDCARATVCEDVSRNVTKPIFAVVPRTYYHDNVCMLCEEWTENTRAELRKGTSVKYNITSEPDLAFYNESNAQAEYTLSCLPNIDEKLSTTTIGIIAGGAFLALLAAVAIFRQQRKKRLIQKEKNMAIAELDRTKDELELGENMMYNPMQQTRKADNAHLIAKGQESDAEILRLRDEVRRLKMMVQRKDDSAYSNVGLSTRVATRMPGRKKEFGQTR